ncbi:hypothetical protein AVDCRST_MAG81-45 [uncultured Synechococcales cyanobacterium]|uniref:Uncharacterized protein n=1 Tax=uncultured Synechococcales cyanobacterium TaxID=1936017 RepID=A0A6J4UMZ8_9CYAN|nr:hypothetical protein AVDCRST_MAG81-45 [uncultured Synechococcales cyanobacterium]
MCGTKNTAIQPRHSLINLLLCLDQIYLFTRSRLSIFPIVDGLHFKSIWPYKALAEVEQLKATSKTCLVLRDRVVLFSQPRPPELNLDICSLKCCLLLKNYG